MDKLKAPFPWFGGKSRVAAEVWARFGEIKNYVEPFAGSLAVLLGRPHAPGIETVNDLDGYVANFWRAMTKDPEAVAAFADWPVNECDLHARHIWLVNQKERFVPRLMGDPDFYDAKIAGWWVWGLCSWIGTGWCGGKGPWVSADGELVKREGAGVHRKRPHLGNAGQGINRQRPHLGNAGQGINRQRPHLGNAGQGINRQRPHLGNARGSDSRRYWIECLTDRLSGVRVVCGDWSRVLTSTVTTKHPGFTGVFLDPPYSTEDRDDCYVENSSTVAHDVWKWAIENGSNPKMRIAVCDYEDARQPPEGWSVYHWSTKGSFAGGSERGRENAKKERIWFSPHCVNVDLNTLTLYP